MAAKNFFNHINPFTIFAKGVVKFRRMYKGTRNGGSTTDQENTADEASTSCKSKTEQVVEIIIDGQIYRLIRDDTGGFRYDHDLKFELINRIISQLEMLINTGTAAAQVIVNTIAALGVLVRYYDTTGTELLKEEIPKIAKEKANEIIENYLTQASLTGRLDPRLVKKADEIFRDVAK